jgi:hypothetical protein
MSDTIDCSVATNMKETSSKGREAREKNYSIVACKYNNTYASVLMIHHFDKA